MPDSAEVCRNHLQPRVLSLDCGHLVWARRIFGGRQFVSHVDKQREVAFDCPEETVEARVVKPEPLEIGVQLDSPDAVVPEIRQHFVHLLVIGMHSPEWNHPWVFQQGDRVLVCRFDLLLFRRGGQHGRVLDARPAETGFHILQQSIADCGNPVVLLELFHDLRCNLRMECVGVDIYAWKGRHSYVEIMLCQVKERDAAPQGDTTLLGSLGFAWLMRKAVVRRSSPPTGAHIPEAVR